MTKSVEAFRTIGEVADELSIPKHVLRFWEVKFAQIRPMKRGGGRRYYRPQDLDLLRGIHILLHTEGYTIKGVQKILRECGVDHVKEAARAAAPPGRAKRRKADRDARQDAFSAPKEPQQAPRIARKHLMVGSAARAVIAAAIAELQECRAILTGGADKASLPSPRA